MDENPPQPWHERRDVRLIILGAGAAVLSIVPPLVLEAFGRQAPLASSTLGWIVMSLFIVYGAFWPEPIRTGSVTWLAVSIFLLAGGIFTGSAASIGWGPFVWYGVAAGFVAGFFAYLGAWLRGMLRRASEGTLGARSG